MLAYHSPSNASNKSKIDLTLQPLQSRRPQLVLRQHPTHGPLQNLPSSPLPLHTLHIQRLKRPRPRRLLVIQLLLHLLPSSVHIGTAGSHNVVPTVCRWIPNRFMFAHEDDGDLRGEAA